MTCTIISSIIEDTPGGVVNWLLIWLGTIKFMLVCLMAIGAAAFVKQIIKDNDTRVMAYKGIVFVVVTCLVFLILDGEIAFIIAG